MLAPIRPSPTIPSWVGLVVVIGPSRRSSCAGPYPRVGVAVTAPEDRERHDRRKPIRRPGDLRDHGRPRTPPDAPRALPAGAPDVARGAGDRLRADRVGRRRPPRTRQRRDRGTRTRGAGGSPPAPRTPPIPRGRHERPDDVRPSPRGAGRGGASVVLPRDPAVLVRVRRSRARRSRPHRRGAGGDREAVRARPRLGAQAQPRAARGDRRRPDLPDRPFPREGAGPRHRVPPVRQRDVRAPVEPRPHRVGADHDGGALRRGGPGTVLRRGRVPARRRPEPSPPGARPRCDGAALGRFGSPGGSPPRRLPGDARRGSRALRARPIRGLPGGRRGRAGVDDRNVRRAAAEDRELAMGRGPVLPARREEAGHDGDRGGYPVPQPARHQAWGRCARLAPPQPYEAPDRRGRGCEHRPPPQEAGRARDSVGPSRPLLRRAARRGAGPLRAPPEGRARGRRHAVPATGRDRGDLADRPAPAGRSTPRGALRTWVVGTGVVRGACRRRRRVDRAARARPALSLTLTDGRLQAALRRRYQAAPGGLVPRILPTGSNHGAKRVAISAGVTPRGRNAPRRAKAKMKRRAPGRVSDTTPAAYAGRRRRSIEWKHPMSSTSSNGPARSSRSSSVTSPRTTRACGTPPSLAVARSIAAGTASTPVASQPCSAR